MSISDAVRWDQRYSEEKHIWESYSPKQMVLDHEHLLPERGIVLDAACGIGTTGRYLSQRGFTVISLDISKAGLQIARKKYSDSNLEFRGAVCDLSNPWLPENHFDIILNFCFLERVILGFYRRTLKPGGLIFFESFVRHQIDIKYSEHYLEKGELLQLFRDFEIIHHQQVRCSSTMKEYERWVEQLIARKPITGAVDRRI